MQKHIFRGLLCLVIATPLFAADGMSQRPFRPAELSQSERAACAAFRDGKRDFSRLIMVTRILEQCFDNVSGRDRLSAHDNVKQRLTENQMVALFGLPDEAARGERESTRQLSYVCKGAHTQSKLTVVFLNNVAVAHVLTPMFPNAREL